MISPDYIREILTVVFTSFFPLPPVNWQPTHHLSKLICPISKNLFHRVKDIYRATE